VNRNGVIVELGRGELRGESREDMLTRLISATCTTQVEKGFKKERRWGVKLLLLNTKNKRGGKREAPSSEHSARDHLYEFQAGEDLVAGENGRQANERVDYTALPRRQRGKCLTRALFAQEKNATGFQCKTNQRKWRATYVRLTRPAPAMKLRAHREKHTTNHKAKGYAVVK
jgi:hypothetical protein